MMGYRIIALRDMLEEFKSLERGGEDKIKAILSDFSCERNKDIEQFLRIKAIEFDRQAISRTYLVFASYREEWVLAGYFTIAQKILTIIKKNLSANLRHKIRKFSSTNENDLAFNISAPLIAQLGINDNYKKQKVISGRDLLALALEKVKAIQDLGGGRVVYLECEDIPALIDFYGNNGFFVFGSRDKDPDEVELFPGKCLIQMLRYIND